MSKFSNNSKENQGLILGLYPMVRGYGYGLFKSPTEVIDFGIYTIQPFKLKSYLKKIRQYLEYYEPSIIILQKHSTINPFGKRVLGFINKIEEIAEEKDLKVRKYSRQDIRYVFAEFKAFNKFEIAKMIVSWNRQLGYRMPKPRKKWMSRDDYNMGIFDALALVYTYYYLKD